MKRSLDTNKLSYGLFGFKGKYFYRNLKDIKTYIKRIFFTLKHGYSPVAKWETFNWFICVFREILQNYRYNRFGSPVVNLEEGDPHNTYDAILDRMLELLDDMDETNKKYVNEDFIHVNEIMENAKNEFFKLFSENFYSLWD